MTGDMMELPNRGYLATHRDNYVEAGKQWYQLQNCLAWFKIQMKQESKRISPKIKGFSDAVF